MLTAGAFNFYFPENYVSNIAMATATLANETNTHGQTSPTPGIIIWVQFVLLFVHYVLLCAKWCEHNVHLTIDKLKHNIATM